MVVRAHAGVWVLLVILLLPAVAMGVPSTAPAGQSVDQLKDYVRDNPQDVLAAYRLGVMYAHAGDFETAIRTWLPLIRSRSSTLSGPSRVKIVKLMGICYFKLKHFPAALRCAKYVLNQTPSDSVALKLKALSEAHLNQASPPAPPTVAPAPAKPTVSPEVARKNFDEGAALFLQAKQALDTGDADAETKFSQCINNFQLASDGDYKKAKSLYYLGASHLFRADDEKKDVDQAKDILEQSNTLDSDSQTMFDLAGAYGLLASTSKDKDQAKKYKDREIELYEKCIQEKTDWADAHFRLALAYDKSDRPDASKKTLENAKLAIKLKPEYKKKFQEVLKNSEIARKIADIVVDIIAKAEKDDLDDKQTEAAVQKIQTMFGDKFSPDVVKDKDKMHDLLNSDAAKKALEQTGKSPEEVEKMLDKVKNNPGLQKMLDRNLKKFGVGQQNQDGSGSGDSSQSQDSQQSQ